MLHCNITGESAGGGAEHGRAEPAMVAVHGAGGARAGTMVRCSILVLVVAVGCAGGGTVAACRVDADCASGLCQPDGTCGALDAGTDAAADAGEPAEKPDAGAAPDEHPDAGVAPGTCAPNHDGRIERAEVPIRAGLYATFRVATDTAVSSAGTGGPANWTWDLSGALANDTDERVTLQPLAGQWFADSFAGATYAARLTADSDLLGVFEASESALLLRGVVSPTRDGAYTRLTYDPPVKVLAFPLQKGANFSTDTTVTGIAQGFAAYYFESYSSTVDRQGTLKSPFGTFDVLRVRTDLTRTVGLLVTRTRSFLFASECFGTVAAITSDEGDTSGELTHASEVRRLAP